MEIKNTLTQKELETLLRYANWAHTTFEWRFGQAIFNGLHIMFPATAEEVRYPNPLDPFYKDTVKADFYSMICPDPSKEEEFDMEYTDEEVQELDEMTQKAIELKKTVLDLTNSFTKKHK